MIIKSLILLSVFGVLVGTPANAQEDGQYVETGIEVFPDRMQRMIEADTFEQATQGLVGTSQAVDAFISRAKLWTNLPIRVCFFGGSNNLRRQIAATAATWEQTDTSIRFDFGDRNAPRLCDKIRSDIRVGYSEPGNWSLVGQDSVTYASQYEQSLNLGHFDVAAPTGAEFQRLVLHEFGHALGLRHEHQNRQGNCEAEYDFPAIYSYLGGPPNLWSKDKVDSNMRTKALMRGDMTTAFDVKSIMLYSFPARFYKSGTASRCYTPGNSSLSAGDIAIMRQNYPIGDAAPAMAEAGARIVEAAAAANLPSAEQSIIAARLAALRDGEPGRALTLGPVREEYVDVDIFACAATDSARRLALDTAAAISEQSGIGRLRVRNVPYPDRGMGSGINVIADSGHPEVTQARAIIDRLNARNTGSARLVDNRGGTSRWYLSVAACE